jgi:hypothetical protein
MNAASTDASRSLDGPSQNRWFGESSSTSSAPGMVSARFWACEKRTPASEQDPVTSVGHATRVSAAHRSCAPGSSLMKIVDEARPRLHALEQSTGFGLVDGTELVPSLADRNGGQRRHHQAQPSLRPHQAMNHPPYDSLQCR